MAGGKSQDVSNWCVLVSTPKRVVSGIRRIACPVACSEQEGSREKKGNSALYVRFLTEPTSLAGRLCLTFLPVYQLVTRKFCLVVGLGYVVERRSAYTFAFSSVFSSIVSTDAGFTFRKRRRLVIDLGRRGFEG